MYPGWCPAQFPYRTVFMSCNSNTTDGTSVAGTAYPGFCGVRIAQSLGFEFVDHCYCFMYLFIKQLHCLFFFNLQLLGRRPTTIRSRPRRSPDEQDTMRGQTNCK